jgi:hypothetical protein
VVELSWGGLHKRRTDQSVRWVATERVVQKRGNGTENLVYVCAETHFVSAVFNSQRYNFQSNTTVYLLRLGYMFRPLFGLSSGNCIKLLKINVKANTKYTLCFSDLTNTNIGRNM